jgi:hypothetical protein
MVPWFLRLEPAATSLLEQGIQDTEWTVIPVSTLHDLQLYNNMSENRQKSIIKKSVLYINASFVELYTSKCGTICGAGPILLSRF